MAKCSNFKNLAPLESTFAATTLAAVLSNCLDDDGVRAWGSFFFNVGSALTTIADQRALIKNEES